MKEATGEANITVITIVLIAIVLAVGTVIVNSVMKNAKKSSCCQSIGGHWKNGKCYSASCNMDDLVVGTSICWILSPTGGAAGSDRYKKCIEEK